MHFENQIIKVFQNTTNSYKYYWWYSILQLIKKKKNKTFYLEDIAIETIIATWYPVNFYKISLGKQDQLSQYIKELKISFTELNDEIKEEDLILFLNNNKNHPIIKEIITKLNRYVPYRFLRPWFEETIGIKDGLVNQSIVSNQYLKIKQIPYIIDLSNNQIIFNDDWFDWIYSNFQTIESFTLFELFKYIEKNNPYVTNISIKLFKPNSRKLTVPTKLWKSFINSDGNNHNSIFEKKPLHSLENLAIDHYLPWSLVTHDKLWNLHPIEQAVNCSKSNKIADNKYINEFTNLQFQFVQYIANNNVKYLEDYFTLFSISQNDLLNFSIENFSEVLKSKIQLEIDLAKNLGYNITWTNLGQN